MEPITAGSIAQERRQERWVHCWPGDMPGIGDIEKCKAAIWYFYLRDFEHLFCENDKYLKSIKLLN
jgi:hypothetical protein